MADSPTDPPPSDPPPESTPERSYTVLHDSPDGIVIVGQYTAKTPDDACWAAVDKAFKAQADAAGADRTGETAGPRLAGVLADRLHFEEYVNEPVQTTRRIKRR